MEVVTDTNHPTKDRNMVKNKSKWKIQAKDKSRHASLGRVMLSKKRSLKDEDDEFEFVECRKKLRNDGNDESVNADDQLA